MVSTTARQSRNFWLKVALIGVFLVSAGALPAHASFPVSGAKVLWEYSSTAGAITPDPVVDTSGNGNNSNAGVGTHVLYSATSSTDTYLHMDGDISGNGGVIPQRTISSVVVAHNHALSLGTAFRPLGNGASNSSNQSGYKGLVGAGDPSTNTEFNISYVQDAGVATLHFTYDIGCVGGAEITYAINLSSSTWHTAILTFNGSSMTGYIDGSSVGSTAVSGTSGSCNTTFGFAVNNDALSGNFGLRGDYHNSFLFDSVLTSQNIADISGISYTAPPPPPPPAPPVITWNVPSSTSTASSTPIADFDAWKLNATGLSTSTTYSVVVAYTGGLVNGFLPHYDYLTGYAPTGATGTISIAKRDALASGIDGVNLIWSVTSTIYRDDTATSSDASVNFVVGTTGGASLQPISLPGAIGGILNDTTTMNTTCDPNSSLIAGSLCNLALLLFYPSPDSLSKFSTLASSTQNKPPFGYLTSFINAVGGIQNASSATSSVVLMGSSTEASLNVIFGPLKTGLAWLLWLLVGFWGIHRLKIFNP